MIRRFGPSVGSALPLQRNKARMGTGFTGTDMTIKYGCYLMYDFIIMFIFKVSEAVHLHNN